MSDNAVSQNFLKNFSKNFRSKYYDDGIFAERMQDLLQNGQKPDVLLISCVDSRSDPLSMFIADDEMRLGRILSSRVVGALVPPYHYVDTQLSIEAGVQFAVSQLGVKEIIVMGHTYCGGIEAMISAVETGQIDKISKENDAIRWMGMVKDIVHKVKNRSTLPLSGQDLADAVEQETIVWSLNNLREYSSVKKGLVDGTLTIRGWQFDMAQGHILEYDENKESFISLTENDEANTIIGTGSCSCCAG